MQKREFNPVRFKEIVKSNTERIANSITNAAFVYAALKGNPLLTADKEAQIAVEFFQKQLAKELYEYLPNN